MYAGSDYANNDTDRRINKLYKHRNYRLILIRAKGTYNKNYNTDVIEDTLEALFILLDDNDPCVANLLYTTCVL
jgi:hypothetical protein